MTAPSPDCGSCNGDGTVVCPRCLGDGYCPKPVGDDQYEYPTCDVCNGRGEVRCGACEEEERDG